MATSDLPGILGPYTVLGVLGEGGMGVVYLAEQSAPIRRTVALKVLRAETGSEQVLARFEAERQALAVMDHPSIAKVFDAGATPDGHSYFAMEVVDGDPITAYCDARRMSLRERVDLFVEVCRAVQHAHQKGVIHRDLKPSNVMVSEVDGRSLPRIIDFGIAKAVVGGEFDGAGMTRDDQVVGTPAYMSPEQIVGSADIDTRSDIFSLGVLLFELLVGALPYDSEAYRGWGAIAARLDDEPPTPAKRFGELETNQEAVAHARSTYPGTLHAELKGDLDWILTRAMEKDREHRYETANALALDLVRYMRFEPVRAHGAGTVYRVGKFVRRNRVAVSFGSVVALGLVVFAVGMGVQADRIAKARDAAEARRNQAEDLIDFMLGDLREKLATVGRLEILDDVGEAAMAYFAALPPEEFTEEELLRRSQALYQIGEVRVQEGRWDDAGSVLAESLRFARELNARDPENTDWLFGLGQSEFWVGYISWITEDYTGALESMERYLAVSNRLVEMDGAKDAWQTELGYAHSNIGSIRQSMGDLAGAIEPFRTTLEISRLLWERHPEDTGLKLDVATSLNTLGVVQQELGRWGEAREHLLSQLGLMQELTEADPQNTYLQQLLGVNLSWLGANARARGAPAEEMEYLSRQERIVGALVQHDPSNTGWRRALAVNQTDLAKAYAREGRVREAWTTYESARLILALLMENDSENPDWRRHMAMVLYGQARVAGDGGRPEEAFRHLERAEDLIGRLGDVDSEDRIAAFLLCDVLTTRARLTGDPAAARTLRERALSLGESYPDPGGPAESAARRSVLLLELGRVEEGRALVREILDSGFRGLDFQAELKRFENLG